MSSDLKVTAPKEEHLFILKMYAEGSKPDEIIGAYKTNFGHKILPSTVKDVCLLKDNKIFIERFKEKYLAEVKAVPIANKRIRFNDLQKMRDTLFAMADSLTIKKRSDRKELMLIFRRVNEVMAIAREEMERRGNVLNQINITELTSLSDEELQKRKEILIAKATGTYNERDFRFGEDTEGAEPATVTEPSEVSVASPSGV